MNKTTIRALSALIVLMTAISLFAACKESDTSVDFDYLNADLSRYITLSADEYKSNTVTLGTEYDPNSEAINKSVEETINKTLYKNRIKTNGDTKVTDQKIKLGDTANIYYTGYLNGTAFNGGSNASDKSPYALGIGSGSFIPGFESGLIGVIPQDTSRDAPVDVNVTFPKDYDEASLAGKAVVFKVWVVDVVQYTVPELTDSFVKDTLDFDGTAAEYKANVKQSMQAELIEESQKQALSAVLSKLVAAAKIKKYPQQSVDYWYARYVEQYQQMMEYYTMYGYTFASLDEFVALYIGLKDGEDWKEVTTGYAKEMVANSLVYYTVAEQQKLSVSKEEYQKELAKLAEQYSTEDKKYTADNVLEGIGATEQLVKQNMLFEKVEAYLLKNCKIEYKDN